MASPADLTRKNQLRAPEPEELSASALEYLAGLASLVESSEDAIISKDLDGRILTWNRGAAALYGYTADEMLGGSTDVLVPPDRKEEEDVILDRIRAGQRVQHMETVRIRKNGVPVHVSLTISPIRDENGIIGASHVARDISERKRLEAANAQLAAIIEFSADAIVSKDLHGVIQTWNAGAEQVYGYPAAEAIGRNISFLLPPGGEHEEKYILDKIGRGERVDHFETLRLKKGGVPIYVSLTISPIRDRNGGIVGVSHVARDVTERRRLEQANAQLAAIVESSGDAMIRKDLSGIVQTWNAGAERIYGYSAEEAIGRNITFLLPPERAAEEEEVLSRLRRGECVEHFETTRLRKDGRLADISVSVSPIRDASGQVIGASHVARDITERKKFEEQLRQTQRLESLGVLAGGVAHDFNNLLTGIIGNGSLIAETLPATHAARGFADELLKAADRAADLTRQLLAYAGKGRLLVGPVNVPEAVGEIAVLLRASIPKTVTVRLDLSADVPLIEADRSQIQQLVMNLIINGAEAIGERPGTVWVKASRETLEADSIETAVPSPKLLAGEYTVIEVRDDGCGMDAATMRRIFEPFFSTKFIGRGLGLSAALGIVSAHKGAIRLQSRPGEGTTFRVYFPASPRHPKQRRQESPARPLILVVDDEEIVRKVAKSTLENYGYRVILAEDGSEALKIFQELAESISLVILDLTMPVMSGEQTLHRMHTIRRVPVILSSGYSEAEATRRFAARALAGFVQKPYTNAQLKAKVEEALGRRLSAN